MFRTCIVCSIAWLIPGGGHLALKKWKRGLLFFGVVIALVVLGLSMEGQLHGLTPGFFGFLKFIDNLSLGLLYFLGVREGWGVGNIQAYSYEYGNTYLFTAGLMNMLMILDSFDIAQGRKQ